MRVLLLTAAMVLGAVPVAFADSTNLIKDGGFEKPVPPVGGSKTFDPGEKFGPWLVTGTGSVSVNSTSEVAGPAWRGAAFLDLTGTCDCGPGAGVEQTIATTPGVTYDLKFRVGTGVSAAGANDVTSTVNVYNGSTLLISAKNRKISNGDGQIWRRFTVSFTASDTQTTLNFVGGDKAGDANCGLDGVVVSPAL